MDKIIDFKTAQYAKQKGFDELCFHYYDEYGKLQKPFFPNDCHSDYQISLTNLSENYNTNYSYVFSAPTQSSLQKWLREKHKILVEVVYDVTAKQFNFTICYMEQFNFTICYMDGRRFEYNGSTDFEAALETGLVETLMYCIKSVVN
jgi:hypothetical protein